MGAHFTIYHNPRCSKSREVLKVLQDHGVEPEIIRYLEDVPDGKAFRLLLAKLHIPAVDLVRKEEQEYKSSLKGKNFNEDEWIRIMRENPKLIQRPIVLRDNTGAVCRPTEKVLKLIENHGI